MKNAMVERMYDMKDRAYEKLFAKRIEQEKKATLWKVLFIVTASLLAVVVAGAVVCTVFKDKIDKGTVARLKARFCRENDDLDFVEEANEDVEVDIVE